ncbi:Armadillo repeat-containing protein 3, partial [Eufriesea mexicana]
KCASKGNDRVDREQQTKNQFDSLHLEVKHPGTTILLLQCPEKPILLAAAAALAKFGSKCQENLEVLFDLEIVDSIISLITHEDLFTRRFAAKLLAEMVAIPNVRNFLLDSNTYIPYFTKVLINEKDIFMHEFSSLILAEISKDLLGTAQLLTQCPDMNLFERLQSVDPDVKRNIIQIIYNLLQDPLGAKMIIETKNFNLEHVYELFNSPYPEIQQFALDVVTDLVRRNQDNHLQNHFRHTNGLEALLKILNNIELEDLHADVLKILCYACDNPITVELFDDIGGIKQILKYIEDTSSSKLFMEALDVAIRLSYTPRGRKALYTYGIINYLLHTLMGNVQTDMYEISCYGIGMMTLYSQAAEDLTTSDCIKNVLDVLKNENLKWSARQAALFALSQLLKCDIKNCQEFLNIQGQNYLLWLMNQTMGKVPVEILVEGIKCFITIARKLNLRRNIITTDIIEAMFPILDDILRFKFCPLEPIYVVNCIREETFYQLNTEDSKHMNVNTIESKKVFLSTEIMNLTMDSKFGRLQCDTCLYDYIKLFKCKLIAVESKNVVSKTTQGFVNVNYVVSRAKMLAKFVVQQMSGPDPLIRCIDHQLEIHLKEIKKSIETSVIPLGMLRVGSYFERALLFKVIADRVHLPAALVRAEYGKAWIEIAVPEVKASTEEDTFDSYLHKDISCPEIITVYESVQQNTDENENLNVTPEDHYSSIFPTKLLKPNFIVDLMESPGDLIPIDSHRARLYCEKRLVCDIVC